MPSTAEIASGTGRALLRAGLNVPADSRVAEPRELVRRAELLDRHRQLLEEVPHGADHRDEEQERQDDHPERGAEHRDGRRQPPPHAGLRHHEAHRVLEDKAEEDPDEDDQEDVADRREGAMKAERRRGR